MSATSNPAFEIHKQTLDSLRRVHIVCLLLEGAQFLVAALAFTLQRAFQPTAAMGTTNVDWSWTLKWYGGLVTFFASVFAHVVVFYVIHSIAKQVERTRVKYPERIHNWLVLATAKQRVKLAPYLLAHLLVLIATIASLSFQPRNATFFNAGFAISGILALVCFVRAWLILQANGRFMRAFVVNGGHSTAEFPMEDFA